MCFFQSLTASMDQNSHVRTVLLSMLIKGLLKVPEPELQHDPKHINMSQ